MSAIALELDRKLQTVNAPTAERLERLAPDALALADVAATDEESQRAHRVERLFEALDGVKEFAVAGRLTREGLHAR